MLERFGDHLSKTSARKIIIQTRSEIERVGEVETYFSDSKGVNEISCMLLNRLPGLFQNNYGIENLDENLYLVS